MSRACVPLGESHLEFGYCKRLCDLQKDILCEKITTAGLLLLPFGQVWALKGPSPDAVLSIAAWRRGCDDFEDVIFLRRKIVDGMAPGPLRPIGQCLQTHFRKRHRVINVLIFE
jgi:hypothetical protein